MADDDVAPTPQGTPQPPLHAPPGGTPIATPLGYATPTRPTHATNRVRAVLTYALAASVMTCAAVAFLLPSHGVAREPAVSRSGTRVWRAADCETAKRPGRPAAKLADSVDGGLERQRHNSLG